MTKELREKMAKSLRDPGESCKRRIRDIRTSAINAGSAAIKDLNLRRQGELVIHKAYTVACSQVEDLIAAKQKEILA